jgi:hypothetical protein
LRAGRRIGGFLRMMKVSTWPMTILCGQAKFSWAGRLRDELTYYMAATQEGQPDEARIRAIFDEYQQIGDQLGSRWMEYRRASGSAA